MKQMIEFHDSYIAATHVYKDSLEIVFEGFVILDVTDEFGFEFEKTTFRNGSITLKNPTYDSLPTEGSIYSGNIRHGEVCHQLVPLNFEKKGALVLTIIKEDGDHKLFCREIIVKVE